MPFRQSGVGFGKSQFSPDARGVLLKQTGVYFEPACFLCICFSTVLFIWPGNEQTYKTLKSLMPHRVKRPAQTRPQTRPKLCSAHSLYI